jgi:signal transduction histidine kinase
MRSREDREAEEQARLQKLRELAAALLSSESTEAVAEAGVRRIRESLPCAHLSVVVFDHDPEQATVVAAFSAGATKGGGGSRWRRDAFGHPDRLALGPILIDDLEREEDAPPAIAALGRERIRSLLGVPLVAGGDLIGVLFAGDVTPHRFGSEEAASLVEAAEILALAVKRARRVEGLLGRAVALEHRLADLQQSSTEHRTLLMQIALAQEQERQRIANDIHDDSVQVMSTAAMRLQALGAVLDDDRLRDVVTQIEDTVRHAVKRLRHLMFDLIPPALERQGLGAALSIYLERMREDVGLTYRLESRLSVQPPLEARAALYRIAQEAITNVVKHARANTVDVVIEQRDGGFGIRVGDDGVGFQARDRVEHEAPMHLGLTAMRQRAEMAGGWCRIRSVPLGGTAVEAWVPDESPVVLPESDVSSAQA